MKPLAQMNVIPFIDIMLVLLAVVLTTATFVAQGKIPVALPTASQAQPMSVHEPTELTIDDQGQVYLQGQPMMHEQLAQRLEALDAETQVVLRVDETVAFRHFVAVVDLLQGRGLENLSIVTRRAGGR